MPVIGMGGYFFRAQDPAALKAWYKERLGVGGGCGTDEKGQSNEWVWFHQGGPMVFEPFKADSDYFPAERTAMVNLRVADLDGLLADLRAAGVEVTREEAMAGVGRFARVHDPEGNPIELWEPEAEAGQKEDGQ
ncbi:MAG TPA: VOC family protein [Allosphingosinicella sp.]|nr:VOC family protein [Allosphingosinicella sp.]